MSQEYCEIHDCDATNGCPQCIANKQATCVHGGLSCSECGLAHDALRASIRQQFEAAGFGVTERVRIVGPVGTREALAERLRMFPPGALFIVGAWPARQIMSGAELAELVKHERFDVDQLIVRAISSSQIWPT